MKLLESECKYFCITLKNRIVRSATGERASSEDGCITDHYVDMYSKLAEGGTGLIITGHSYVDRTGANGPRMAGIHNDSVVANFSNVVKTVHAKGSKILLQISHCGRQTNFSFDGKSPPAPSVVAAPGSLLPREMSHDEIKHIISSFIRAAGRAKMAGFDGVELHGAHGYLISQFVSPFTNRRNDEWGGSYENRFRFVKEIISGIKGEYPEYPLLIKWNSEDFVEGGLSKEESLRMVLEMEKLGLDGIEISGGVFESSQKICRRHIKRPEDEGYFADLAIALKKAGLKIPIILVGGFRTASVMERNLEEGTADLIALCRPLIKDPFLLAKLFVNSTHRSDCTSCNGCLMSREGVTRCTRI